MPNTITKAELKAQGWTLRKNFRIRKPKPKRVKLYEVAFEDGDKQSGWTFDDIKRYIRQGVTDVVQIIAWREIQEVVG